MGNKKEVYPEKGFGSFNMSLDCLDEFDVQRSFVFLSEWLDFDSLQDELNQRNLLSEKETKDYIFNAPGKQFRAGKLIKLIIKKRRCNDFVACLKETSNLGQICEKILEVKGNEQLVQAGAVCGIPAFTITDELLQRHFEILYTYLEPRKIADEMFQADLISVSDHDIVTDSPKKTKRLRSLLVILKMNTLYGPFLLTLERWRCDIVVDTLKTDSQCIIPPSRYAMWIQHNFTILQEELPDCDCATVIMKDVLSISNISDIESCYGAFRQKSKLLKILLMNGQDACKYLLSAIEHVLNREDLVLNMESKTKSDMDRGKPVLIPSLTFLTTYCLQEHEDLLYKELEPIAVCDYLFEEEALNILDHDIITETKQRQKQIKRLIEKLTENKNDCFHFFLYILQKEEFEAIRKTIENPHLETEEESNRTLKWKLSHSVVKVQDDVNNEPIEMRLTVYGPVGEQVEQVLYERLHSTDTEILGETLSHGQVDIDDVFPGSVVIRLRPVTDQAVQTLIGAKENNKLLQMIFGILRKVNIAKIMSDTKSLKIRIQVFYDMLATSKQDTDNSKGPLVEKLVKVHRNVLLSELDPMVLIPALSKSISFPASVISSLHTAPSRFERVNIISSFVENGNPDVVNEFIAVLKDHGHCDILELLDPSVLHSKAEEIRKKITYNYENILNEMQMTLAKETLSKCIGYTGMIKEKILPRYGNRKQRMSDFLRFILQDDHNVLEFEKMLKRNDLYELLLSEESVQEDQVSNQDIEVTVVEDTFSTTSEGTLFDSVITLSYTEGEVVADGSQLSLEEQLPDLTIALQNDEVTVVEDTFPTTSEGTLFDSVIPLSYTGGEVVEDDFQLSSGKQAPDSTTALPNDDCLDERAVRKAFVYLKENLNFYYLRDEFIRKNVLSEKEIKECTTSTHCKHLRNEKILKLIIKKKRCKEFVICMKGLPEHRHIIKKIRELKKQETQMTSKGSQERLSPISVTDELLKKHFNVLYTKLEPRVIADQMFQAGQISVNDHDYLTDDPKKYRRMMNLLDFLKQKQFYAHFLCVLESLQYTTLLATLITDRQLTYAASVYAVCIQHNFTTLQNELPEVDQATFMMEHILTESDVSDIKRCSTILQKSTLLKILILKGEHACKELMVAIGSNLRRKDLIPTMMMKNKNIIRRGKPDLSPSLRCLSTSCLQKHEEFFYDELEPLEICDFLFEERAVDIPSHDKITESFQRRKQIECLLEIVMENKHDCFYLFLYFLHKEGYHYICQKLEDPNLSRAKFVNLKIVSEESARAIDEPGFWGIMTSTDHSDTHKYIMKKISSNYQNILDEMQLALAKETLSKCIVDVDEVWTKILPGSRNRRQRMNDFLQFVLKKEATLIELEKTLKNNGLRKVIDTWTEYVESRNVQYWLHSFNVSIPTDPKESIAKALLDGPMLTECLKEVEAFARKVIFCTNIKSTNTKPGTVCVLEVVVTIEKNQVVIYEKNPEDSFHFLEETHKDLVKVILIEGIWESVSETKGQVYQKYKQYIDSGTIHLQHVSEQYVTTIAKLSACQKLHSYKQYVELLRASIPLHNVEKIVRNAADRALTEVKIMALCCDVHIDGIGCTKSGPKYISTVYDLDNIKRELKKKTVESIMEFLGSEICAKIKMHTGIKLELKNLQLDTFLDDMNKALAMLLPSIMKLIASTFIHLAIPATVATGFVKRSWCQDVNSRSWRESVAKEINKDLLDNRCDILSDISSRLQRSFIVTNEHLKVVAKELEDFSMHIKLID